MDCTGCPQAAPPLLAENVPVLELFARCCTQWRTSGFGVTGLDYPALYLVAQTLNVPVTRTLLDKIRRLERAELARMNERAGNGGE